MTISSDAKPINRLVITAAYYVSFIVLGLVTAAEGPSLPSLARHTTSPLNQISLIFVAVSIGYLIGSFLGGMAYDRLPGHRLMGSSLMVIGAAAFLLPIAQSLWLLLTVFFILGSAKGALDVGCNTLLLWVHGEKVGPFMNGLHFFYGVGAFLAPLILAQVLAGTGDIVWVFWLCSLACAPLALWLWILPELEIPAHAASGEEGTFPVFPVVLVVSLFVLYVGLEMGFGNWIYTYALTLGLGTQITAAYLNSALWGAFTLGRLLGVWISTRLKSQVILFLDLAGCIVSIAVILLWRDSVPVLWAGTIGLGLFMASIFPTILMLAGERMHVSGAITGWFLVGAGGGNIVLPWLIGQAFVFTGPQAMPFIVLIDIVCFLLVLVFFITRKPGDVTLPTGMGETASLPDSEAG